MGRLNWKTRRHSAFSLALLVIGIGGMLISAFFDLLRAGASHFGIFQLAGFVVAAFVAVAGLRGRVLSHARLWDGLLLSAYLAGIFFMGLRFEDRGNHYNYGLLRDMHFTPQDAFINLMGFIPLGYLMTSFLSAGSQRHKDSRPYILSLTLCVSVSFVIEFVQSYLPGRASSIVDLSMNTMGALIGVLFCLVERRVLYESRSNARSREHG
jgi:VanZ like family